jgi:hypothetical protein
MRACPWVYARYITHRLMQSHARTPLQASASAHPSPCMRSATHHHQPSPPPPFTYQCVLRVWLEAYTRLHPQVGTAQLDRFWFGGHGHEVVRAVAGGWQSLGVCVRCS